MNGILYIEQDMKKKQKDGGGYEVSLFLLSKQRNLSREYLNINVTKTTPKIFGAVGELYRSLPYVILFYF